MIFYKNGWHLCNEKVKYIQHGEELIQYVMSEGHDWWVDFEEEWEHTEIIEFMPVEPAEEQLGRFEEINQLNIPEGFGAELGNYVESGIFPEGFNHVLRPIQIQVIDKELEQVNAQSSMETYAVLSAIQTQSEIEQAEMLMEVLNAISELINPQAD